MPDLPSNAEGGQAPTPLQALGAISGLLIHPALDPSPQGGRRRKTHLPCASTVSLLPSWEKVARSAG